MPHAHSITVANDLFCGNETLSHILTLGAEAGTGQPSEALALRERRGLHTPLIEDGGWDRIGCCSGGGGGEAKVYRLDTHFLSQVQLLRTEVEPSLQLGGHWTQWDSWDHDEGRERAAKEAYQCQDCFIRQEKQ